MSANETIGGTIFPGEVQALIDAIQSIGGGALSQKAADNLQKAVKATVLQGKKSTVSITLSIKKANDEMITIEGDTKASIPSTPIAGGFFYNPRTFMPSRNRQDQMVMDFKKGEEKND
jgi:hypothetical protein